MISWFSCGAASAVATKIALRENEVDIVYLDTGSEHPDNRRFLRDCEAWFGQKVRVLKSEKYEDIWDVFGKTRYLAGVSGARCTYELKRKIAEDYLTFGTPEVFGYTVEEGNRIERFIENNPERSIVPILRDRGLTKEDCLGMLDRAGIEIPAMYRLGFSNNNCIGCVKGQMGYWNRIRKHFPEVFERMAELERELNVALCKSYAGDGERKRVFLDELEPEDMPDEVPIVCGLMCEIESDVL